jgi:hypothetical protein
MALGAGIGAMIPPLLNELARLLFGLVGFVGGPDEIFHPLAMLVGLAAGLIVVRMRAAVGDQGLRLQVPFGPFLVVGALVWLFGGPALEVRVMPRMFGLDPVPTRAP